MFYSNGNAVIDNTLTMNTNIVIKSARILYLIGSNTINHTNHNYLHANGVIKIHKISPKVSRTTCHHVIAPSKRHAKELKTNHNP